MKNINIVELIEKNPIIKFPNTINNKLLEKIKQNFTQHEQKQFISLFYCYLNYDKTKDFIINLDDIWKWLQFTNKANSKILLQKHFVQDIDYKFIIDPNVKQKKEGRGGHNKETIMLNVNTFKKFCLKAGTSKANEIHDYFIKLEETIYQTLIEQSQDFTTQIQNLNIKVEQDKVIERHNFIIDKFSSAGPILYLVKVKSNYDSTFIIKIISSKSGIGLENTIQEQKSKYEQYIILDCFLVQKSKDFETFLFNHHEIKPSTINNFKGSESEKGFFLIGKLLNYKRLIKIINENISNFNNISDKLIIDKLIIENENTKQPIQSNQITQQNDNYLIKELIEKNKKLFDKVERLEHFIKEKT